jgi:hypothetical protein
MNENQPTLEATRAAQAIYEAWNHSPIFQGEIHLVAAIIDREMGGWRPIEEAMDGVQYIVVANGVVQHLIPYQIEERWFSSEDNSEMDRFEPTHFRPLPTPPQP